MTTPTIAPLSPAAAYPYARLSYRGESAEGSVFFRVLATEIHLWPDEWVDGQPAAIVAIRGSDTSIRRPFASLWDWGANAIATTRDGYHRGYSIGVDHAAPVLWRALEQHVPKGTPVHYSCHSRGAGQGYETARRQPPDWPVGSIVTFGAPGVYTRRAVAEYPYSDRCINVRNSFDIPTRLAVHLRRPGVDIKGPGKWHGIKHYAPKPEAAA